MQSKEGISSLVLETQGGAPALISIMKYGSTISRLIRKDIYWIVTLENPPNQQADGEDTFGVFALTWCIISVTLIPERRKNDAHQKSESKHCC